MGYVIEVRTVSEQSSAAAKQRTTHMRVSQEIRELLRPWAFLKEHSDLSTDGHNVAIYWDERDGGSIEVGVQIVAICDPTDEVVCSATPGGVVATTAHCAPYDRLGLAHKAVMQWCRHHGRQISMPYWEVYGDWEEDPSKLRTDVYYLLN